MDIIYNLFVNDWISFIFIVEYDRGQSPRCMLTGKYTVTVNSNPSIIAISSNGEVVAIATDSNVEIFSALDGHRDQYIENIYDGPINALIFDPLNKYFLTAGDRHIRVFHNVTGYRVTIEETKKKLKQSKTETTVKRLEQLIVDCEEFLTKIKEKDE